jgi:AcrR family transcriptional regulator
VAGKALDLLGAKQVFPQTRAQVGRYNRILAAARAMLEAGGEEALQMKDLPEQAEVSLATVYRYFASKDHLLLAIALDIYQKAYEQVRREALVGDSVRERLTRHLLRQFRAEQRNLALTSALHRVLSETSRVHTEVLDQINDLHVKILCVVAGGDRVVTPQQRDVLPAVLSVFGNATRRWMCGGISAAEAQFQIRIGCHLVELPGAVVDASRV